MVLVSNAQNRNDSKKPIAATGYQILGVTLDQGSRLDELDTKIQRKSKLDLEQCSA